MTGGSHKPAWVDTISLGNVITIGTGIVALAVAWGALQADIKVLAQRVDKGESRDDETSRSLSDLKGAVIELRTDARATRADIERQGRQLDRIEQLLQSRVQTPAPMPPPQPAPSSIVPYPR